MIKEAIILAGGFGTRLQPVVSDLPKPMAPVCGKPFLHYVFLYLKKYRVEHAVLSVGHLAEKIENHFGENYLGIKIQYAYEKAPLGTGGGIRLAMECCESATVFALNGDTLFDAPLDEIAETHFAESADATLALRKVKDGSRYGTIQLEGDRITSFTEKNPLAKSEALINGGIYVLKKKMFLQLTEGGKNFSIENDFFARHTADLYLQGVPCENYFIDIGIPEDYARAQIEFESWKG